MISDHMKKTILLTAILVFLCRTGFSQANRLEADLERDRVSIGNPVYLNITFYGSQNIKRMEVPEVDGLRINYVGPSTHVSIVNGKVSQSITHAYLMIPSKEGEFKLGPFSAEYEGKTYYSAPVTLSVTSGPSAGMPAGAGPVSPSYRQSSYQGSPSPAPDFSRDRIFLIMEVPKNTIYVNEIVPLTIKLYVTNMGLKDIVFPSFAHEGFSTDQWKEPEKKQESYNGRMYNVLVFRKNLSGIKEGTYVLGPASISCKAMVQKQSGRRRTTMFGRSVFDDDFFSDMFGGYEIYPLELESEPLKMDILPFPEENKPRNFEGAVGDYNMDVVVTPEKVKVGDPITLKTVISGLGNMDTVTAPKIAVTEDFKTYEPQVSRKDNKKIYEQIFIPKTDEITEIPEVTFSYFSTKDVRYKTVKRGPFPVKVQEQPETQETVKVVSMGGDEQIFYPAEKLGQDIIYIREDIGTLKKKGIYIYRSPLFRYLHLVPLVLLAVLYFFLKKKEKIRTDERYARFLKAPRHASSGIKKARMYLKKNNKELFYDTIYTTLREYLSHKLDIPKGSVSPDMVGEKLRGPVCGDDVREMIKDIFKGCEMARYTSSGVQDIDDKDILDKLRKVIDCLEKVKI